MKAAIAVEEIVNYRKDSGPEALRRPVFWDWIFAAANCDALDRSPGAVYKARFRYGGIKADGQRNNTELMQRLGGKPPG